MSASQSLPKDPAAHQESSPDNKDDTRKNMVMTEQPWCVSNDTSPDSKRRHVKVSTTDPAHEGYSTTIMQNLAASATAEIMADDQAQDEEATFWKVAPQNSHNDLPEFFLSDTNWVSNCNPNSFGYFEPRVSILLDTQPFWNLESGVLTAFYVLRMYKQYLELGRCHISTPPPKPTVSSEASKSLSARVGMLNDIEKMVCGTGDKQNGQAESTLKQRDIADSKELDRYEKEKCRIERELLGAQKVAAQTTNELQRNNYERSRSFQGLVANAAVVDNRSGTWTGRFANKFRNAFKIQSKNEIS